MIAGDGVVTLTVDELVDVVRHALEPADTAPRLCSLCGSPSTSPLCSPCDRLLRREASS